MRRKAQVILIGAVAALAALAGCSSSSKSTNPSSSTTTPTTAPAAPPTTRVPPATGPAAQFSGPITGGKGIALTEVVKPDLTKLGYTDVEYFASGNASSFISAGPQGTDGHWSVTAAKSASYRTRIIVRRPTNPARFNGTLLVEWLNVSSGADTAPDFMYAGDEITRSGYAWVGVSVQKIGVSGGDAVVPVAALAAGGIVGADPARYGSLHHPGDQYALDMFTQVARALRTPGQLDVLGRDKPQRVLAVGESQSAFQLTTYIDAIQPTTHMFDGFLVHSRGGGAIPISGGNIGTGIAGGIRIRDDNDVPVFLVETETDESQLEYFDARQPDSQYLRLWDVAGAAHADAYVVGGDASIISTVLGCKGVINTAPTHYIVAAALSHLDAWVRTGTPPPSAPRMKVALVNGKPQVQRDAQGNAIGGVRTGANDVPVAALSGTATDTSSTLCALFGSTKPFDQATLHRLYPTPASYLTKFRAATDKAIANGYLLPADRPSILAEAAKVKL